MAELNVKVEMTLTPAKLRWGLAGLLLFAAVPQLGSESVTLTTYYPAPSGVYNQMITTGNTWAAREGGALVVGTTAVPGNGVKMIIMGGRVGIGTASPDMAHQLDVNGTIRADLVINPTYADDDPPGPPAQE